MLKIDNLRFRYEQRPLAIDIDELLIEKGESIGIIGPNGAGKSTLLQLLLGIQKDYVGTITLNDIRLDKKTKKYFRDHIGLVFQNPDEQLFMPTVYDDVAFGLKMKGINQNEIDVEVEEVLDSLGIKELKDRASLKLSGGEKKRVAMASIFVMHPDIMVFDEPTLALDPKSRRRVINIMNSLEKTKLITSHDLDMIYETCTRVIVLYNGKIVAQGKPHTILSDVELMDKVELECPLILKNLL
jgi:ABC-type cobalt transport system, ATPase component